MAVIPDLIKSADPISESAALAVLQSREESAHVDFKADFNDPDREWLELTKDAMAFANTEGGYLAFGVKNGTYELVGVNAATASLLRDPNNWLQKLNRFVEPPFTTLRCRELEQEGKKLVVVFIPPSLGLTHIVTKDGAYKLQSGQDKTVLRQGTLYVRRSGANNLATARDLDAIVTRRLEHFKSSLLDKIARVVESPPDTDVFIVKRQPGPDGKQRFVIENAPDAIKVKGLSFSVTPEGGEEEIAAWIAMTAGNRNALPPAEMIWSWYSERKHLQLTNPHKLRAAFYSLLRGGPCFYWFQRCERRDMEEMLIDLVKRKPSPEIVADTIAVSAFLGKAFHTAQVGRLGFYAQRLGAGDLKFPVGGPRSYFEAALTPKQKGGKVSRAELERELDEIARSAVGSSFGEPDPAYRYQAQRLDCLLYAQDDKYPNVSANKV